MWTPTRYPEVAEAYKQARLSASPSVNKSELARAVGVSRRHIIRIENGEHRPQPELRDKIAQVLGVDPTALPALEEVVA
jgi:transcriptional regulator with XRE-family HTH domain